MKPIARSLEPFSRWPSILHNPNIVYAGSVNGGVWRTNNIEAMTAELAGVKVEVTVAGDNTRNEQQIVTVKETKTLLNRLVPQLPRDGELAGVYRLADPATTNVVWAPM